MSDTLLRFVHISDTHLSSEPSYSRPYADHSPFEATKALIKNLQALPFDVDFILHTGDINHEPQSCDYSLAKELFSELDIPIYYIAGNTDCKEELQAQLMGRAPADIIPDLHYEFEHKGVQIICMDSNGSAPYPAGRITDEQLEWLDLLCSADDDRPLIIAIHHHALDIDVPWLGEEMIIRNGLDFHEIVKKACSRLVGVFHGHIHQATTTYREAVMYCSAASVWTQFQGHSAMTDFAADTGARSGYSVVMIKRDQSFIRRYWFDVPLLGT